jgi:uncharacterized protein YndB with AHSA1/START domain
MSRAIVVERHLPAPPGEVFDAWSRPERLAEWMRPGEAMRPATVEVDFRVGGRFRIVMHDDEGDYEHEGEYLEIDPPRRLVFTWISRFLDPEESATRVTVELEPDGAEGTHLRLTHDEIPPGDSYEGHPDGWRRILEHAATSFSKED